ncbi:MAG TPA: hypothetical protein VFI06_09280 [Chitinophagaceae bacterium]|nr:hypothetical protein [Chitinophagaceae bacterium]
MNDLKALSTPDLIDLLSDQTAIYYKLVKANRASEQLHICREFILELHLEIEARKANSKKTSLQADGDNLSIINPIQ